MELPLWLPLAEYAGIQQASVERARAAGSDATGRSPTRSAATLADAEPVDGVGLTPERERELLASS